MTPTELLDELQIPYVEEGHEHCREGWIQLDCPFCTPDSRHWRMGFNLAFGYVNCWSCGKHGLVETLCLITKLPYSKAREICSGLEKSRAAKRERVRGTLKLPYGVGPIKNVHRRYLKKRKLDPDEMVRLWNVQGITHSPDLPWRLFIPIDYHGETVSWTTRSIVDTHRLRYRSASLADESIPHKSLLYGEDYARHSIVIVEGPIDVWTIGPGAVATMGTGLMGNAQLAKMSKYPVRAVCFDNEPQAQKRARQLVTDLSVFPGRTYNVLLSGKDANESPKKEIKELRRAFLS